MMEKKRLPIGISRFAQIREGNYYYVDKTQIIIEELLYNVYATSLYRPRFFGKSLLLDTIAELYAGNKALFTGLYAENHWNWDETYPVARFSFERKEGKWTLDEVRPALFAMLEANAQKFGVELYRERDPYPGLVFRDLLHKVCEKQGKRVVVLIDDYDKPVLDNMDNPEVAKEIAGILRSFYSELKASEEFIYWSFIVGLSKFGQTSIFSGLNNIIDGSFNKRNATLCGYTQAELEEVFAPELEGVDVAALREYYLGYNWVDEQVYNPWDILSFFKNNKTIKDYWLEAEGGLSPLLQLVAQKKFDLTETLGLASGYSLIDLTVEEPLKFAPWMFKNGYLTVKEKDDFPGERLYRLKYPNREVQFAFNRGFLNYWSKHIETSLYSELGRAMTNGDIEQMQAVAQRVFASIPADETHQKAIEDYPSYWASVFFAMFVGSCEDVRSYVFSQYSGGMDLQVIEQNHAYFFKFKILGMGKETSVSDYSRKGFFEEFQDSGKQLYDFDVRFDPESRKLAFVKAG